MDRLKQFADTFDDMASRLEAATESRRRLLANPSHKRRTPLSIIRAELDVDDVQPGPTLPARFPS
jgi:signal transduction histidine kinase